MWGSAGRILCSVLLTEWGPEGGGSHLWPSPSIGGTYHVHMGDLGNPHPATPHFTFQPLSTKCLAVVRPTSRLAGTAGDRVPPLPPH